MNCISDAAGNLVKMSREQGVTNTMKKLLIAKTDVLGLEIYPVLEKSLISCENYVVRARGFFPVLRMYDARDEVKYDNVQHVAAPGFRRLFSRVRGQCQR